MNQSENINELISALSKAQGMIEGARKDTKNTFFKSNYADLNNVWEACRFALSENGLAVIQTVETNTNTHTLVTTLAHSSGQWIKSFLPLLYKDQSSPQAFGGALTYARRYALAAIVGVSQEDDDGEAAEGREKGKKIEHSLISEEQKSQLLDLLNGDQIRKEKMLQWLNIDSLENMTLSNFNKAINTLNKKSKEAA